MGVTTPRGTRPTTSDVEVQASRSEHLRTRFGTTVFQVLGYLAVSIAGLSLLSTPASAHEGIGHGGFSVGFAVVIGLPVVTGLLGGVGTVLYRNRTVPNETRHRASATIGFVLLALGGTFAISAVREGPLLGLAGGSVGVLTTRWLANRDGSGRTGCGRHTDLALSGVCTHRVLEGIVLGTLYTVGAAVGLVGVLAIAGHTALETAAVGGLYASRVLRALGAVLLIQGGYVVGAVVGVGIAESIPVWVHVTSLGLVAGVFLVLGVDEMRHSMVAVGPLGVPE